MLVLCEQLIEWALVDLHEHLAASLAEYFLCEQVVAKVHLIK